MIEQGQLAKQGAVGGLQGDAKRGERPLIQVCPRWCAVATAVAAMSAVLLAIPLATGMVEWISMRISRLICAG